MHSLVHMQCMLCPIVSSVSLSTGSLVLHLIYLSQTFYVYLLALYDDVQVIAGYQCTALLLHKPALTLNLYCFSM